MSDCYEILGVDPKCSDAELRTAWRRLSKAHHPDRHRDQESKAQAHQRFARISVAYSSIVKNREAARPRAFRAPDICIEVLVTLEDAFRGRRISAMVPLRRICDDCQTAENMVACDGCDGEGMYVMLGEATVRKDCGQCGGTGRVRSGTTPRCRSCLGLGIRSRTVEVGLQVPPGAVGPCEVRAEGQGEDSLRCETRGDVLAFLQIPPTGGGFERVGCDLVYLARIGLEQALRGGAVSFRHLDGTTIQVPPMQDQGVVRQRTVRLLEGLGMPSEGEGPGDLVVCYEIDWPRTIDGENREELAGALGRWRRKRDREPVRQNPGAVKEGGSPSPCKKSKLP